MVKKIAFSAACLLSLAAAQAADAKPDGTRRARPAIALKIVAPEQPALTPTIGPIGSAPFDFGDRLLPMHREYGARRRPPQLIGALAPADNVVVGVGLWRVDKVNASDPNRANPMRETRGRTRRVAAVGLSLSF